MEYIVIYVLSPDLSAYCIYDILYTVKYVVKEQNDNYTVVSLNLECILRS